MSLSDMLEILAMSRLIAIWTGSPVEGKESLSREEQNRSGCRTAWALLPASPTRNFISKTAEAQRARHSFKALGSQMTSSSKMKLLLLGNWSSVFGDGTRQQISMSISHLNEHFSGICQREAKASLFLVIQSTMFAQWEEQQALHDLFHTCSSLRTLHKQVSTSNPVPQRGKLRVRKIQWLLRPRTGLQTRNATALAFLLYCCFIYKQIFSIQVPNLGTYSPIFYY